jgi:hypothetical protein
MLEYWETNCITNHFIIPPFHYSISFFLLKLCALCFLFVHPLVSIPGRPKGKEGSISIKGFVFFVFPKKKLCDLCVLCG